ncbi:uncharacterized protein LOC141873274 [Acropora palmata]|uniref:uncharacterized protein LOC141873274 n=1 Tax=Acropora palmata TaxID=6131 RepID=UPI003DA18DFA
MFKNSLAGLAKQQFKLNCQSRIALSGYAKNRFHVMRPPTAIQTTSKVKLLRLYVRASFVCQILVNYSRLFLDMVGTKHCSWGRCNMDSRYPDRMPQSLKELQESGQKVFIPFVKPWHDLERCKKWVNACSRKNFTTESITNNSYICALHWPKQKGPTEEFPDPLKANLTTEEMEKRCRKRKAPTRREFESTSNGKKAKTLSHQGKIQSSFLDLDDVPEIIQDMNKEIMTENDKATQTDVSKYVLACQIANRVERVLLRNQMNVSSEHEQLRRFLPKIFKTIKNIRCSVDCTEFRIETSRNFAQQGNTYSSYKHTNTYKCMIACTPNGGACFVSDLFEGDISDVQIFEESGILKHLEPHDLILADRGFTVEHLVNPLQAKIRIPAFLKGRKSFTAHEELESRKIAKPRIHIERFNQRLKQFKLVGRKIPLSLSPLATQLVVVACALVNFQEVLCK